MFKPLLVIILSSEISRGPRNSVSSIFFWNEGSSKNRFLLTRRELDGFVHSWTRSDETSLFIFESFPLCKFVQVFLCLNHLGLVNIRSWEFFFLSKTSTFGLSKLCCWIIELTVLICILSRPWILCFVRFQMIH